MATALSSPGPAARRALALAQHLRDRASRDAAVAAAAEARLGELAPTAGELVALLSDRNPFVRSGAAWWLRQTAELPADAVDALRTAAHDPNPHVVQAALGTCGVRRAAAARDDARACLNDANPAVVHSAIFALGRLGPSEEGAHLVRFLHSSEPHLEMAAVVALTNLRYAPAAADVIARLEACRGQARRARAHFDLPRRHVQALVALQARQAVPLLVRLACDEVGLRGLAVQALIDLKAAEAAPALVPLLRQLQGSAHEEKLCCALLYLMTSVDYRFAMAEVRAFLGHRLPGVRCAALKAVARWGDGEALEAVRQMAREDASAFVRPAAVAALGELLGEAAVDEMAALTEDSNSLVRSAAAEVLRRAGGGPMAQEVVAGPAALPAALRAQAAAARAFLEAWRAAATGELAEALGAVLIALE